MQTTLNYWRIAIVLFVLTIVQFVACNDKEGGDKSESIVKSDTIKTLMLFVTNQKQVKYDIGYRILKDSFRLVPDGGNDTYKKERVLDSLYFIPQLDSLKDQSGKIKYDSIGKPIMQLNYYLIPNSQVLIDGGVNIDSALKRAKL